MQYFGGVSVFIALELFVSIKCSEKNIVVVIIIKTTHRSDPGLQFFSLTSFCPKWVKRAKRHFLKAALVGQKNVLEIQKKINPLVGDWGKIGKDRLCDCAPLVSEGSCYLPTLLRSLLTSGETETGIAIESVRGIPISKG